MQPVLATAFLLLLAPAAVAQATQTLPRGFEARAGNAALASPFGSGGTERWHFVYDAAQLDPRQPILISRIDFRADEAVQSWSAQRFAGFELRLSTANAHYARATYLPSFDANLEPRPLPFATGALDIAAGASGSVAPSPWTLSFTGLEFPFDPLQHRDLILELRTRGDGSGTNPRVFALDAQQGLPNANGGNAYGAPSSASATSWTTSGNELVPLVRIHYSLGGPSGLLPRAHASATSGASPLAVQFTDASWTTDPGGIVAWEWDFDGDGAIDSTQRDPSFVFTRCGDFLVRLYVTDRLHGRIGMTGVVHLRVDPDLRVEARFAWSAGASTRELRFRDQSLGSPTSWAWDFESDGLVDSVQRHPTWTAPSRRRYVATLTARNACQSSTVRVPVNLGDHDECTRAFDLDPLAWWGRFDTSFATTSAPWPCGSGGADLWFHHRPTTSGIYRASTCERADFDTVLQVFDGSCGALRSLGCSDDACGTGSEVRFFATAGASYYVRVGGRGGARGGFELSVARLSNGGAVYEAASGCGGSRLSWLGRPELGTVLRLDLATSGGTPLLMLGTSFVGLPFCAPRCVLGPLPEVVLPTASASFAIPMQVDLFGAQLWVQGLELGVPGGCLGGVPLMLVASPTYRMVLG